MDIVIGHVSLADRALFAKHLSVMLKSGVPITEALATTRDTASGKLKQALGGVLKSVESGRSLSASMAEYPAIFSGLLVQATYAGETSGTLVENLEHVALQLEKEKELTEKIRSAMFYPIIVLGATFILGTVLAFWFLPKLTPLFEGLRIPLPLTTRILIRFSHVVQDYGGRLVIGIVVGSMCTVWLVRQRFAKPLVHWLFLHTILIKKIARGANIARFARTLGTLLESGIGIGEALEITKNAASNYYYVRAIDRSARYVQRGEKLSKSLTEYAALFPPIVTRMIRVGEESGRLDETLLYIADFYDVEVDTSTKALATAVEPILLLIIGVIVGGLALSIITPIYEITGNISR